MSRGRASRERSGCGGRRNGQVGVQAGFVPLSWEVLGARAGGWRGCAESPLRFVPGQMTLVRCPGGGVWAGSSGGVALCSGIGGNTGGQVAGFGAAWARPVFVEQSFVPLFWGSAGRGWLGVLGCGAARRANVPAPGGCLERKTEHSGDVEMYANKLEHTQICRNKRKYVEIRMTQKSLIYLFVLMF